MPEIIKTIVIPDIVLSSSVKDVQNNRVALKKARQIVNEVLAQIGALARANEAMCKHENAISQYNNWDCPDCGKSA